MAPMPFYGSCPMTDERRRELAEEFARDHGVEVEPWMLSPIWEGWIGCENCNEGGKEAPCWGKEQCHGYSIGCGCASCVREDRVNAREP